MASGPDDTPAGAGPVRRRAPAQLRRDRHLHLRLTADEFQTLATAATVEGVSLAAYTATAALQLATGARVPVPATTAEQWQALVAARLEAQRIRHELTRIATRHASAGEPPPEQLGARIAAAAVAVAHLDRAAISLQPKRRARQ